MTHVESRERREKAVQDVKEGLSVHEAAAKYGLTVGVIEKACCAAGVRSRDYGVNNYEIIAKLLKTKSSLAEIARESSVSRQRVHQIYAKMREAGIEMEAREEKT